MGTKLGGIVDWVITPATKVAKVGYNKSKHTLYQSMKKLEIFKSLLKGK